MIECYPIYGSLDLWYTWLCKKGRMGSWCCWNVLIGLFYISPAGLHIVRFPDPHVFQRKFKTWLASISLDRLLWLLSLFMLSGGNKKKLYLRIFRVSCFIFCLCPLIFYFFYFTFLSISSSSGVTDIRCPRNKEIGQKMPECIARLVLPHASL